MTNNDINDIDEGAEGDFDKDVPQKASLKETWDSNPVLKVAAIVLGGAVLIGGYLTFFGGEEDVTKAVVGGATGTQNIKVVPGKSTADVEYVDQLKTQNQQNLAAAQKTQGSFIPQPIDTAQDAGIQIPPVPQQERGNPLDEWRQKVEAKRIEMEDKAVEEEEAPAPEIVPLPAPVRPQPAMKQDPQLAKRLAEQMRVIIAAQAPQKNAVKRVTEIPSAYMQMLREEAELEEQMKEQKAQDEKDAAAGGGKAKDKIIVPAGSIVYAQLLNELNSDVPGPALAQVLSGPLRGGRALGEFQRQDEYLTLTFSRVVKDGVVYDIDGIALDEETTLPAHQTEVDHHYWSRVILPAAAEFVRGYAAAVAETGTSTTTTSGGGVATEQPEPDETEELMKGLESASGTVAGVLRENAKNEITVVVAKGTTMGVLMMDSVTTKDASN